MRENKLLEILNTTECEPNKDNCYYFTLKEYPRREFIIIFSNKYKTTILYNMDNRDLHFITKLEYRNQSILSDFFKKGLLQKYFPELKTASICGKEKRKIRYLLKLANIKAIKGHTI